MYLDGLHGTRSLHVSFILTHNTHTGWFGGTLCIHVHFYLAADFLGRYAHLGIHDCHHHYCHSPGASSRVEQSYICNNKKISFMGSV